MRLRACVGRRFAIWTNPKPAWELPGSRTKNHKAHVVALSPQAAEIIRAVPRVGALVFSTTGKTPLSGFSKAKGRIDHWIAERMATAGAQPMRQWSLHDLRRTMVTMMNEQLSVVPHVVEAVVNHVTGSAKAGVAGVYNRALYAAERREALNRWAEYIYSLPNPPTDTRSP